MSKTLLTLDDDYDFSLIGISCHAKDYRICWEINNSLNISLIRVEDYEIRKKKEISKFSFYEFIDENNYIDYYLIANKGNKGNLIKEQKTTDFFLLLKGNISDNQLNDILSKINALNLVLTAFKIMPESLKSKQNLIF
jgi:hypothetical protein